MTAAVLEMPAPKYKIGSDVAGSEFDRMCDANRIDRNPEGWAPDEVEAFDALRARIVRDLRTGLLIVSETGAPTFTPPGGKPLTFHRAKGSTYMALETTAGGKNIANMCAAMADLAHTDRGDFAALDAPDFNVCVRLATLFLADR